MVIFSCISCMQWNSSSEMGTPLYTVGPLYSNPLKLGHLCSGTPLFQPPEMETPHVCHSCMCVIIKCLLIKGCPHFRCELDICSIVQCRYCPFHTLQIIQSILPLNLLKDPDVSAYYYYVIGCIYSLADLCHLTV